MRLPLPSGIIDRMILVSPGMAVSRAASDSRPRVRDSEAFFLPSCLVSSTIDYSAWEFQAFLAEGTRAAATRRRCGFFAFRG
jgi:hypothetical protein